MEAKNFRIGNLVEYDDRVFRIHSLAEELPTLDTPEFGIGVVDWNNLKPIELTEQWLLNMKFKYQDRDINTKQPERFYISEYFGEHREYWIEMNLPKKPFNHCFIWMNWNIGGGNHHIHLPNGHKLKYVHELQNLFFALTGEELELKTESSTCI